MSPTEGATVEQDTPAKAVSPAPDAQAQGKDGGMDGVDLARQAEGNAWERMMTGSRALLDGAHSPKASDRVPDTDGAAQETGNDGTKETAADATKKDGEGAEKNEDGTDKPKDGADAAKDGDARHGARYVLTGADGKPIPDGMAWPEGAKMRIPMDGRTVTVRGPDQLVAMAQRGAMFDREQARSARLTNDVSALSERVEKVNAASQDVLLAVLFGTEERTPEELADALREELAPFRDPRYRKGLDAERQLVERERADETASTEAAEARTAAIWSEADEVFEDALEAYPYLEAGDAPAVKSLLHAQYMALHRQAVEGLAADAKAHKWTSRQYTEAVEEIASQALSREALRAAMTSLNDTYARRLKGKAPAAIGDPSTPSPPVKALAGDDAGKAIEAEADAHNRHVDRQLDRQDASRTLKGGGSSPSGTVSVPDLEGKSYEEQQQAWKKMLHSAGR